MTILLLQQICNVLCALKLILESDGDSVRPVSPGETDAAAAVGAVTDRDADGNEWIVDDLVGAEDDADSAGEESDEDSLCNKVCTFQQTQKLQVR